MSVFNYTDLRYFDKSGNELVLKYNPAVSLKFVNNFDNTSYSEYAFYTARPIETPAALPYITYVKKLRQGYRYTGIDASVGLLYNDTPKGVVTSTYYDIVSYKSSSGTEQYPEFRYNNMPPQAKQAFYTQKVKYNDVTFPMLTFESKISFDKVSTDLVETQSLYVLVENENAADIYGIPGMTSVREYANTHADASTYIEDFKLLFFIDNRDQQDFRLFKTNGSDVIWTDRIILDLNNSDTDYLTDNGYRVDIGFCGKNEGVYEQDLFICLIDKATLDASTNIYPIGTVHMSAEAIGEDERYRTFFTNFGIPDPKEYDNIFRETENVEDGVDYISINKHSKQMYLSYPDIFPYVGSYKALINAIKTFGYEDIFFKEWYKELGKTNINDGGYVTYDIGYGYDTKLNTISNVPVEERIHLKKMNWLSMFYKINEELDKPEDEFGFPEVEWKSNYYNTNNLVKVISLKKWLEKYVVGVNCRITDITGEGVVFERYSLPKFGKYQQVFDYKKSTGIYPIIKTECATLFNSTNNIDVDISSTEYSTTLEEFGNKRFCDLCEGYFDVSDGGRFLKNRSDLEDSSLYRYYGRNFTMVKDYNDIDIATICETKSFRFGSDFVTGPALVVDDDKIFYDPYELVNKNRCTIFNNPPVIQIKEGYIKRYNYQNETNGKFKYYAKIYVDHKDIEKWDPDKKYAFNDVVKIGMKAYMSRKSNNKGNDPAKKKDCWWYYDYCLKADIIYNQYNNTYSITPRFNDQEYVTLLPPASSVSGDTIHLVPVSTRVGSSSADSSVDISASNIYTDDLLTGATMYNLGKTTKGLVYCDDNINGIPTFKIYEYENLYYFNANSTHFPILDGKNDKCNEYYLEILEGRMLFNSTDGDGKDIIVALNFSHDGDKQKLNVTISKNFTESVLTKYWITSGEYLYGFKVNDVYPQFSGYINHNTGTYVNGNYDDPDNTIEYNPTVSLKVYHAGKYSIGATVHDYQNNMFSAKSEKTATILPSKPTFTHVVDNTVSENERATRQYNKSTKFSGQPAYCIYEYVPFLKTRWTENGTALKFYLKGKAEYNINSSTNPKTITPDTGTNTLIQDGGKYYSYLSNGSDRFICTGKDSSVYYSFLKKSSKDANLIINSYTDCSTALDYSGISSSAYTTDMMTILSKFNEKSYENSNGGTPADVYVTLFDNVVSKPVLIIYGELATKANPVSGNSYGGAYEDVYAFMVDPECKTWLDSKSINLDTYFSTSRYSIFATPAWAFPIQTITSTNLQFEPENGIRYPFERKFVKDDICKLLYSGDSGNFFGQASLKVAQTNDQNDGIVYFNDIKNFNADDSSFWGAPQASEFMMYNVKNNKFDSSVYEISLLDTITNRNLYPYITPIFSVAQRDFNVDNGIDYWNSLGAVYSSSGVCHSSSGRLGLVSDMDTNSTHKWSIYKRNDVKSTTEISLNKEDPTYYGKKTMSDKELFIQAFNKSMSFKLDKGIYDIELTQYDKYGNKGTIRKDGLFIVE